jgi:NADH-quinone oxidoreductase subunit A
MAMQSNPYIWQYLPLAIQILVAIGLACFMVVASYFLGKHRRSRTKLSAYECGMVYRQLPHITGSRLFGFWEMLVYLGFVAVGLFYVWKKGVLNWSGDRADL